MKRYAVEKYRDRAGDRHPAMRVVEALTVRDNHICHLASRVQRLMAVQDQADREGNAEALRDAQRGLRWVERTMDTVAAVDAELAAMSATETVTP